MEDLLQYAVDYALKLGAIYAEARYQRDLSDYVSLVNGVPLSMGYSSSAGISVRVFTKKGVGFSATNTLTRDSIRDSVEKAYREAVISEKMRKTEINLSSEEAHRVSYMLYVKENPTEISLEEKLKELMDVDKALLETKINLPTRSLHIFTSYTEKIVCNSDGALISSKIPRVSYLFLIIANMPGKGTLMRWLQLGESGGWENFKRWNILDRTVSEAKVLAKVLEEGKTPPKEPVDVILGPELVGIIVHESCGHPSELDRIWGREGAEAGESYMKLEMLGERIGSDKVTVIDDPTIPNSYGFYLYDDEGVKARPRYLFKNGIINEFLMNREFASLLGTKSNAAARASQFDREPIIRMANTYMAPGDWSFEEMLKEVKKGVYIKSFAEWNICDRRWFQRYGGLEAYYIENGEIKYPVRNPFIEFTTKGFYSKVEAVGKEVEFFAATCGKGNPMQGVPVWAGGPHVLLRNVKLSVAPPKSSSPGKVML